MPVRGRGKVQLRCVGCKSYRTVTTTKLADGRPFCPKCGNMELVVKAKSSAEKPEGG